MLKGYKCNRQNGEQDLRDGSVRFTEGRCGIPPIHQGDPLLEKWGNLGALGLGTN